MSTHEKYAELLAGHALGSLDDSESLELFSHLESCLECNDELPGLQSTIEALAWAAEPVEPPPGLKDKIMALISETPQESTNGAGETASSAQRSHFQDELEQLNRDIVVPLQRSRRMSQWTVAACMVLLAGTIGWAGLAREGADPFQEETLLANQVASLAGDSSTVRNNLVSATGDTHGTAMVGDGQMAVMAQALPPLEEGYQYVVWEQSPEGDLRAVRGFNVNGEGDATLVSDLTFEDISAVAISLERSGNLPESPDVPIVSAALRS